MSAELRYIAPIGAIERIINNYTTSFSPSEIRDMVNSRLEYNHKISKRMGHKRVVLQKEIPLKSCSEDYPLDFHQDFTMWDLLIRILMSKYSCEVGNIMLVTKTTKKGYLITVAIPIKLVGGGE